MKLTMESVIRLNSGLGLLDGWDKVVKQGETERIVRTYYKLTAGFRLAMAINSDKLQNLITLYQKARNGLIRELAEDGGSSVPDDKQAEFNRKDEQLLETVHEVKLTRIKEGDLDLDNNPIPISHLALLKAILWKQPEPDDNEADG